MSISAFSAVSRFLFSSKMLDAVLKSLSLSTLAEGAARYGNNERKSRIVSPEQERAVTWRELLLLSNISAFV